MAGVTGGPMAFGAGGRGPGGEADGPALVGDADVTVGTGVTLTAVDGVAVVPEAVTVASAHAPATRATETSNPSDSSQRGISPLLVGACWSGDTGWSLAGYQIIRFGPRRIDRMICKLRNGLTVGVGDPTCYVAVGARDAAPLDQTVDVESHSAVADSFVRAVAESTE